MSKLYEVIEEKNRWANKEIEASEPQDYDFSEARDLHLENEEACRDYEPRNPLE